MRLVVVDHSLINMRGHHFNYGTAIYRAAHASKIETVFFCHRACSIDVLNELPSIPVFSADTYCRLTQLSPESAECIVDDYRLHRDIFFQELTSYVTPALTSDDLVLFHTIQLSELEAIWAWYTNLQKKRPKLAIILRFDIYAGFSGRVMPEKSQEFYGYYIKQLHQVSPTGVRFFTDTRAMAEQYSQTGVHFELIPIPLNLSPEKSAHCKDPSIHLVFLGDAFAHKGFGLVVEAIPQVLAENPNIHFTVQVSNASRSYEILKELQQVTLIDRRPSEEEYYQIMSSATALLLPYDPASYRFQSSHIFIESILRGIPVICSENGSMFPDLVNCGMLDLVFSPYDTQAMVNKILQFSSSQSFFSNKFIKYTKDLVDFHTSENFIRVLTSTTKTSTPTAASSIHFFTIVLNGEPFIRHHIDSFKHLPFKWHWHIIEGVADFKHETAWSLQYGGRITDELHKDGLSNDGTTEYLDQLVQQYPANITIYRKPSGQFWDGKLEMVNAPLQNISEECLLWQIDADECWTSAQIIRAADLFRCHPDKMAAYYYCNFYVAPKLITTTRNTYGNQTDYEWLRTWRYKPGDHWLRHEPPQLCRKDTDGTWHNLAKESFAHALTEQAGLVFDHYAYATEAQVNFKEIYYGYRTAISGWRRLQTVSSFPVLLRDYFPWVSDGALVAPVGHGHAVKVQHIIWLRPDSIGDIVLSNSMLSYIRELYPQARLTVVCQDTTASLFEACPLVTAILPFNSRRFHFDEGYQDFFVSRLAAVKADLVLNSVHSRVLSTELLALACLAPERIAFFGDANNCSEDDLQQFRATYTKLIPSPGIWKGELERYRDFLAGLGMSVAPAALQPKVWLTEDDELFADALLQRYGLDGSKTIILFAAAQIWIRIYEHYGRALASICREQGYTVVAVGTAVERDLNQLHLDAIAGPTLNLCGDLTIRQTAALIKRCCLAVGAETGTAHIAAAVGTPHVVVIGGGYFGRFMPYSPLTTLVCLPLTCYYCTWRCRYRRNYCVVDLPFSVLEEAIRQTLAERSSSTRIFYPDSTSLTSSAKLPAPLNLMEYVQRIPTERLKIELHSVKV